MICNCEHTNISQDDLRLVRGNDFGIIYPIRPKYPDGSTVEDFDLNTCTDLFILIRRDGASAKDVMTYAESYTITGAKELTVNYDGLKMKLGSYRLDISGKFQGNDWRSYSRDEGFGIVEANEDANIPVGSFIADGVYTVICDFLMTYQTQEQADWDESDTAAPSYIKNKPTIPTSLSELESDSTHRTVTDLDKSYWDSKSDFSGSYDDLTDKPTIPEEVTVDDSLSSTSTNPVQNKVIKSALDGKVNVVSGKGLSTNDYTTTEKNKLASLQNYDDTEVRNMINAKYTKPQSGIPASDIASGVIPDVSNFITKSVNDLVNYYTKSQTYTQSEVNSLIAGISGFEYEVVATLPTASASTMHKIYLVPSSDPQTQNIKDEYITLESSGSYSWELIGNTSADLSGYVTTQDLNTALADYTTTTDLNTLLAGYQTKIDSTHKLDYSLLSNTPTIPDAQIQSDWDQTTTTAKDYIKNKPTIPSAQVNSDWNASSGVAQILNKPTIPSTLAELGDDTTHRVVTDTEKSTWDNKANKVLVVNHGTDDTTYTLPPNQLHIWGEVASLAISLGTPTDATIKNEYMIQFTSGATATQFSLPQGVEWGTLDPEQPNPLVVKANAIYQISIENNIGLWTAISNS